MSTIFYDNFPSGAAAAVRLAKKGEFSGKSIVVILPHSPERHLASALFEVV